MATKAEILERLNPQQRDAVVNYHGKVALEAIPGSGKTFCVTSRAQYMIADGVAPSKILAFTFTKKAAQELKDRVAAAVGVDADRMTICTYHSFCGRLLRRFAGYAGRSSNFSIYDEDDKKSVLDKITKDMVKIPFYVIRNNISDFKLQGLSPSEAIGKNYSEPYRKQSAKIYALYEEEMIKRNAFDFDDLPFWCYRLAVKYPEVLESISNMYDYIIADENQDSNAQNLEFILMLGSKCKNIFVVGDTDQSIYGFRGADIKNVIDTYQRENFNIKYLSTNYRSTQNIIRAADYVIKHNKARFDKDSETNNEIGSKIKFGVYTSTAEETKDIVKEIKRLHDECGKKYSDIAILCRINSQSRSFEEQFLKEHIPYELKGILPFYQRSEVKDLLAYIKCVYNPNDLGAFERIVNVPKRKIGTTSLKRILLSLKSTNDIINVDFIDSLGLNKPARNGLCELGQVILHIQEMIYKKTKPAEIVNYIREAIDYDEYLDSENLLLGSLVEKKMNLDELARIALTYNTIEDFLANAILDDDIKDNSNVDSVNVMTMHSSKGLEFDTVFLTGINDYMVPHIRSQESVDDIEEERRLFYVAMTRAKKELYITYAKTQVDRKGNVHFVNPSRFIKEIPAKYLTLIASVKKAAS